MSPRLRSDDVLWLVLGHFKAKDGLLAAVTQAFEIAETVGRHHDAPPVLVGRHPVFLELLEQVKIFGPSDANVLVHGESGTGKELVARALHLGSARRRGPFLTLNCAAIPSELLEAELFGHKRGSFTGAMTDREGLISEG